MIISEMSCLLLFVANVRLLSRFKATSLRFVGTEGDLGWIDFKKSCPGVMIIAADTITPAKITTAKIAAKCFNAMSILNYNHALQ